MYQIDNLKDGSRRAESMDVKKSSMFYFVDHVMQVSSVIGREEMERIDKKFALKPRDIKPTFEYEHIGEPALPEEHQLRRSNLKIFPTSIEKLI